MKEEVYPHSARLSWALLLASALVDFSLPGQDTPPGPPPNDGVGGPPADNADGPPGAPPGMPPGGGGPGSPRTAVKLSGAFTVDGTTQTVANKTITSDAEDVSGVYVLNGGALVLSNVTVTTTGNTSSQDNSSFNGQNAGVLVNQKSRVAVFGGSISTTGGGANGLFAYGEGSFGSMTGGSIIATGDGGHGVMASGRGSLAITNVDMTTERIHGGVVATDRGGGTIWVSGGRITSHGQDSPGIVFDRRHKGGKRHFHRDRFRSRRD